MTKRPTVTVALFVACAATAACSNKLSGNLSVDGEAFELQSCRSGQVYGFRGVELSSKSGARLRLAMAPTGEAVAIYLPTSGAKGIELGRCGMLTVTDQKSTINGVRNVEGSAKLSCEASGHGVKGETKFSNCH